MNKESVKLDKRVQHENCDTPEPTVREMIFMYYNQHFGGKQSNELVEKLLAELDK
jgi:hypothetical protein